MIETVLILPLIFAVLAMVIYFGRGVVRVQRALVMDRYQAWHDANPVSVGPTANAADGYSELNQTFFGGHADSITARAPRAFPQDAPNALVAAATAYGADTGQLAQLVVNAMPDASGAGFNTQHPNGVAFWNQFEGPIAHAHTRIGNEWKFINAWSLKSVNLAGNIVTPLAAAENDPQRKTKVRVTSIFNGQSRIEVSHTAGGGVIDRGDAYVIWQHNGSPPGHLYPVVRTVFYNDFDQGLETLVANDQNCLARGMCAAYLSELDPYKGPTLEYSPP